MFFFFCSGASFQPAANSSGYDVGNSCLELRSQTTGAGFSDDEGSLSPPRHTYILEQCNISGSGPRLITGSGNYINRINESTYSDDELGGFNSSDDAISYPNTESSFRHHRNRIGTHPQSSRQHQQRQHHRSEPHTAHTYTIHAPYTQHYCPDAL